MTWTSSCMAIVDTDRSSSKLDIRMQKAQPALSWIGQLCFYSNKSGRAQSLSVSINADNSFEPVRPPNGSSRRSFPAEGRDDKKDKGKRGLRQEKRGGINGILQGEIKS